MKGMEKKKKTTLNFDRVGVFCFWAVILYRVYREARPRLMEKYDLYGHKRERETETENLLFLDIQ